MTKYINTNEGWVDEAGNNVGNHLSYKWVNSVGHAITDTADISDYAYEEIHVDEDNFIHCESGSANTTKESSEKFYWHGYYWHGKYVCSYEEEV